MHHTKDSIVCAAGISGNIKDITFTTPNEDVAKRLDEEAIEGSFVTTSEGEVLGYAGMCLLAHDADSRPTQVSFVIEEQGEKTTYQGISVFYDNPYD